MPEETIFAFERDVSTSEVAEYLRTVADRLDAGEGFTLESGESAERGVLLRRCG